MKIAIIMDGVAPVPATKGGAVETLVEHLINGNEKEYKANITVISIYDEHAKKISSKYNNSKFVYFEPNKIVYILDKVIYFICKDILRIKSNMKFRNVIKRFNYINKVSKYLKNNDFDKIVIQNHTTLYLALKKNFSKYQNKYYLHLHNEIKSDYGCKEIILGTKKILGISKFICDSTKSFLGDYDDNNIRVLHNCVDTQKFNRDRFVSERENIRKKYNIKEDEVVAIFSGRLTAEKGIMELLKAFNEVKSKNIKLLIVGSFFYDSDMASNEDKEINLLTKKIRDKVIFTGYISHEEIPKIYSIADFAVLPSIWNEPAGLTIIESLSSSLPVITTYSGGIPEYVNSKCAFLIKRDKNIVNELSEKIDLLAQNSELRDGMSKYARIKAKEFDVENYFNNFYKLIIN